MVSCMKDWGEHSGEIVPHFSLGRVSLQDHSQLLPDPAPAPKFRDGSRCDHIRRASLMRLLVAYTPRFD